MKLADLRAATGTVEENTASEPARQPQGNGEMRQLDAIEPLTEVIQQTVLHTQPAPPQTEASRRITVSAQVHDPPATSTTSKTTATMTDHIIGDWSPFSEREQEKERLETYLPSGDYTNGRTQSGGTEGPEGEENPHRTPRDSNPGDTTFSLHPPTTICGGDEH